MSYCRFSCDDFKCDAYIYTDRNGAYVVHLASTRIKGDIPAVPFLFDTTLEKFKEAFKKRGAFLKDAQKVPITLPYAGDTFYFQDAEACRDKVKFFMSLGYNIPKHVLQSLEEEISNSRKKTA